jgi:hypothetical protein
VALFRPGYLATRAVLAVTLARADEGKARFPQQVRAAVRAAIQSSAVTGGASTADVGSSSSGAEARACHCGCSSNNSRSCAAFSTRFRMAAVALESRRAWHRGLQWELAAANATGT